MRSAIRRILAGVVLALLALPGHAETSRPASEIFGDRSDPAPLESRAIGSYARGCMAGGVPLAVDGPSWQVMRLSRNRNWGHPRLVSLIERLAAESRADDWNGLLVGDLTQPRGGPMTSGHASHQIGLDADIWLTPMPDRRLDETEREEMSAISMLAEGTRHVDPERWTPSHGRLIRRAAEYPEVARIFVHPGIKKRPWWGHHFHFHIRMSCPDDSPGCVEQNPPPPGDGCGEELAWWLSDEPWEPSDEPAEPRPPLRMADLPDQCRLVLDAGDNLPQADAPLPPTRP